MVNVVKSWDEIVIAPKLCRRTGASDIPVLLFRLGEGLRVVLG